MNSKMRLTLLRHAKSLKNVQHRHGGLGSGLIAEAEDHAIAVARKLSTWSTQFSSIHCAPRPQCSETADLVANQLGINVVQNNELRPVHLGVIDGLSDSEVSKDHPQAARSMREWRDGRCEVWELKVPAMEDPEEFYERGVALVSSFEADGESLVIVATRSTLTLLASILLGRSPVPGGNYRYIEWRNCDYISFDFNGHWKFVRSCSTVIL